MGSIAFPYVEVAEQPAPTPPSSFVPRLPVVFVVPAYNEEANLPRLLEELETRWPGCRCVVVDDGSADGTVAILESYSGPLALEPVLLGRNQGPGAAFRAGFGQALAVDGEAYVVTLEA